MSLSHTESTLHLYYTREAIVYLVESSNVVPVPRITITCVSCMSSEAARCRRTRHLSVLGTFDVHDCIKQVMIVMNCAMIQHKAFTQHLGLHPLMK